MHSPSNNENFCLVVEVDESQIQIPRIVSKQTQRCNPLDANNRSFAPKDYYRINLGRPALSNLIARLDERFGEERICILCWIGKWGYFLTYFKLVDAPLQNCSDIL